MKIIKLSAINSTNSFLKEMVSNSIVDDFTVVVAEKQTSGRGQMNTKWESEAGKNLIMSAYCVFSDFFISKQKYLNYAVSISVFEAVKHYNLPKLAIKWPNDILSEKDKIGGILIENSLQRDKIQSSVIGVGLNVNQEGFSINLPNASSIKNKIKKEIDLEEVLNFIVQHLHLNISLLKEGQFKLLEEKYLNVLYKKNVPSMFKNSQNVLFMGKIVGVSLEGKLQIELNDETIQEFGLKEVSFA